MSKLETYLQLSEEFGGSLFGPIILPEYKLGSAEGNEVQLAEGLGVEPFHVRLILKGQDTYYLAPVERSAAVWLYRAGAADPELLHGPTIIRPGDGFSLVTPEGVRFSLIQKEEQKRKRGQGAGPAGTVMPEGARRYGNRLIGEVWRRVRAQALATYFGRMLQNTWFFVRTGQLFSPLYVIGFLTMFSGWGYGLRSCNARGALQTNLATTSDKLEDCKIDRQMLSAGTTGSRASLGDLAARILDDGMWEQSLEWGAMTQAMKDEIKAIFDASGDLDARWYLEDPNPYKSIVARLEKKGMPAKLARMVAWTSVNPFVQLSTLQRGPFSEGGSKEYWDIRNTSSRDYRGCLRGPMRLSYAQAQRLGLSTSVDTWFGPEETGAMYGDLQARRSDDVYDRLTDAFNGRLGAVLGDGFDPIQVSAAAVAETRMQTGSCWFSREPDQRLELGAASAALASHLGPNAPGMPDLDGTNGVTSRLARLFLYELNGDDWHALELDRTNLGATFATFERTNSEGAAHVAAQVGRVVGQAIAIPCMVMVASGDAGFPAEYMGPAPDFDACAILMARARFEQL